MSCYETPTSSEGTNIFVENQKSVLSIASFNQLPGVSNKYIQFQNYILDQ